MKREPKNSLFIQQIGNDSAKTAVKVMERYVKTAISSKLFPIFVVSLLPASRYINYDIFIQNHYCTVDSTHHILPLKGLIAFLGENLTVIENVKSTAKTKCQHNPKKIHKTCKPQRAAA